METRTEPVAHDSPGTEYSYVSRHLWYNFVNNANIEIIRKIDILNFTSQVMVYSTWSGEKDEYKKLDSETVDIISYAINREYVH